MTESISVQELIERCREDGARDVADTMDLLWAEDDIFAVDGVQQPLSGEKALHFRAGLILGAELEKRGTSAEKPKHRRQFLQSLKARGYRRLADAFEYCWERPDEVQADDFEWDEIPLEGEALTVFSVAIPFAIAHNRKENGSRTD